MIYLTMFKNIASIFMGKKRFYYRVRVLIWNLKALYFIEFSSMKYNAFKKHYTSLSFPLFQKRIDWLFPKNHIEF